MITKTHDLYWVAILLHPAACEEGGETALILGPKAYLATTQDAAKAKAIREIDPKYADQIDQVEVLVRSFRP